MMHDWKVLAHRSEILLLLVLTLLLFVLPVPGTIALRHALLAVFLLLIAFLSREQLPSAARSVSGPLLALGGLSAWLLIQAFFVSPETAWAWREIKSQWLPAMLAFIGGVVLACGVSDWRKLLTFSMLALLAQAVFALIAGLPEFLANGAFPPSATRWTAGKLEISYANNLLLAFLAVDLVFRALYRRAVSYLPLVVLLAGIALVIISNLAFGARNGVVGSVLMLASLAVVVFWRERHCFCSRRVAAGLAVCIALVGVLGWISYRSDVRWQKLAETAAVGWDIDGSKAWLDRTKHEYPVLNNGESIDPSAYVRIAWIHAGLRMVIEHPLGVGYGRNAFGHALRKHEDTPLGHAHSGIIDLTVATGWPGLLLWLAFIGLSLRHGWRRYRDQSDPRGLILFFVTAGFFGRMLLDSINRDHMLVMFFLLLGTLLPALSDNEQEGKVNE